MYMYKGILFIIIRYSMSQQWQKIKTIQEQSQSYQARIPQTSVQKPPSSDRSQANLSAAGNSRNYSNNAIRNDTLAVQIGGENIQMSKIKLLVLVLLAIVLVQTVILGASFMNNSSTNVKSNQNAEHLKEQELKFKRNQAQNLLKDRSSLQDLFIQQRTKKQAAKQVKQVKDQKKQQKKVETNIPVLVPVPVQPKQEIAKPAVKVEDEVTVVFTNKQRYELTHHCLRSFFTYNTYPVKKIILVEDGKSNPELQKLIDIYKNVTFVVTQINLGQISAIDVAYSHVDTQFYLHCQTDNIFIKSGFIETALKVMKKDPNIGGVILRSWDAHEPENYTLLDGIYGGFTFHPGLHRMSHYKQFQGGYTGITGNYSYGTGVGASQLTIGYNYYVIKKHSYFLKQAYTIHIGGETGQGRRNQFNQSILEKDFSKLTPKQVGDYKVAYSWREVYKLRNQYVGKIQPIFKAGVKVQNLPKHDVLGSDISQYGLDKHLQVQSELDYLNITNSQYYIDFCQEYSKFYSARSKNMFIYPMTILNELYQQRQRQLAIKQDPVLRAYSIQLLLALKLLKNPDNLTIAQANKNFFNKKNKYQIFRTPDEMTICAVVYGTKQQYNSQKFLALLKSMKNQVYNEFTITFVGSPEAVKQAYQKAVDIELPAKNLKVTIIEDVNNYKRAGMNFLLKSQCWKNSIVVNFKPTDELVGNMAFKIIHSAYEKPELLFATFRSIKRTNEPNSYDQIKNLNKNLVDDFRYKNEQNLDPFLKTFRHKMTLTSITGYYTEFVYDEGQKSFKPQFYDTHSDDFQTYSFIELAGPDGVEFFDDILIIRSETLQTEKCYSQKQNYVKTKAQLKTPLKRLSSVLQQAQVSDKRKVPDAVLNRLKDNYKKYQQCLKK